MNTQQSTLNNSIHNQCKLTSKLILSLLVVISSSAHAFDSYQQKVLFTPSNSNLQAEARGRVMIYDGLKSETVELVMDEQFDRIENMMFVGTQYIQESGEYETEEDDCE
jgi:hypothetical protein